MPLAVKAAIKAAIQQNNKKTDEESQEHIVQMERDGRLLEECWS